MRVPWFSKPRSLVAAVILAPCETIMAEIGTRAGSSFCELRRRPGASPSGVHQCDDAPFPCEFTSVHALPTIGSQTCISSAVRMVSPPRRALPGSEALVERQYHEADREHASPPQGKF